MSNQIADFILIKYSDGQEIWEEEAAYRRNPPAGSFVLSNRRKVATKELSNPR